MSRYECDSCSACGGGRCDKCSLSVCINNMESHRELFKLKDDFDNKVYYAINSLESICNEIINKLHNYSIYIQMPNNNDKNIQAEQFLNNMKNKYQEISNNIDNIKNEITNIKNKKDADINMLNQNYSNRISELNKELEKQINEFNKEDSKFKEELESRKKIIGDLNNSKNNINNIYNSIDDRVKSIIDEEKKKEENDFIIKQKEIDNKYNNIAINENDFAYKPNEIQLQNQYLNDIRQIKAYSDKIPNFYNWINLYNLNKYLN